jgi:hypothetical protein
LSPAFAVSTMSARRTTSSLASEPGLEDEVDRGDSRSWHGTGRDFVCVFLDPDFLPVCKSRLLNIELPCVSVVASGVLAEYRLLVSSLSRPLAR